MQLRVLALATLVLAVAACGTEPAPSVEPTRSAEPAPSDAPPAAAEIDRLHAHVERIAGRTTRQLEASLERRVAARLTALARPQPPAEPADASRAATGSDACHVGSDGVLSCRVLSARPSRPGEIWAHTRPPAR